MLGPEATGYVADATFESRDEVTHGLSASQMPDPRRGVPFRRQTFASHDHCNAVDVLWLAQAADGAVDDHSHPPQCPSRLR